MAALCGVSCQNYCFPACMSQICVAASMKSLDPNILHFLVLFGTHPVCKGLEGMDDTLALLKLSKKTSLAFIYCFLLWTRRLFIKQKKKTKLELFFFSCSVTLTHTSLCNINQAENIKRLNSHVSSSWLGCLNVQPHLFHLLRRHPLPPQRIPPSPSSPAFLLALYPPTNIRLRSTMQDLHSF